MKRAGILAFVLAFALASVAQAAPVRSSGVLSWWNLALGFFGLKADPIVPIPLKNDFPLPPRPGDPKDSQSIPSKPGGFKGRLHIPGGWTVETDDK